MVVFFKLYVIPTGVQLFFEAMVRFILVLVHQQVGRLGYSFFSFFFLIFVFILLLNLISLMPFSFAPTSHIIWTLVLSLSTCLGIFLIGIFRNGVPWLKIFVPEVPLLLFPFMISIELLSYILRSFSLAIRLSANILAGHTLVHIISNAVVSLYVLKSFLFIFCFFIFLGILLLELGVAFLQAYVFLVLISMYLNDALHIVQH